MPYKEFEDASYTELRKNLLRSKGSDEQREFLSLLRSSCKFPDWIRGCVEIEQGEPLPILEESLTESEFMEPPKSTEKWIFDTWKSISPANASRVAFWGFMSLRHIEEGKIESFYLAGGLERIDRALHEGTEKEIDDIVRTALRLMGGCRKLEVIAVSM